LTLQAVQFNASGSLNNNSNYVLVVTNGSDTSNAGIQASLLWAAQLSNVAPFNPAKVQTNVEAASAIFGTYVAQAVNVNDQATVNLNIGVINVNNVTDHQWLDFDTVASSVSSATGNDYSVVYNVVSFAGNGKTTNSSTPTGTQNVWTYNTEPWYNNASSLSLQFVINYNRPLNTSAVNTWSVVPAYNASVLINGSSAAFKFNTTNGNATLSASPANSNGKSPNSQSVQACVVTSAANQTVKSGPQVSCLSQSLAVAAAVNQTQTVWSAVFTTTNSTTNASNSSNSSNGSNGSSNGSVVSVTTVSVSSTQRLV
jgi:hypothetical protein